MVNFPVRCHAVIGGASARGERSKHVHLRMFFLRVYPSRLQTTELWDKSDIKKLQLKFEYFQVFCSYYVLSTIFLLTSTKQRN